MGRKIPGRKHHGVRDPIKQNQQRFQLIKNKINAPPTSGDENYIPKSIQRLRELRDKVKNGDFKRKKPKPKKKPMFEKLPHENNKQFLYRINQVCEQVKKETAFENKYHVEIKRDEVGEVVDVVKRPKDPVELMVKQARKEKKEKKLKKKKKTADEPEVKLTKSQKRKQKLLEKKKQKEIEANGKDFSNFVDHVKFGEQAHAPPQLAPPKRVTSTNVAPRPGERNLLLKSMLGETKSNSTVTSNKKEEISNKSKKSTKTSNIIDKTGKRKNLPNALRRRLDKLQKEVIEAYKVAKLKKTQS